MNSPHVCVTLEFALGDSAPIRLEQTGSQLSIGRDPDCDFILPDSAEAEFTSAHHARLIWEHGRLMLADLQSTNGTLLNGQPVSSPQVVRPGDRIELGRMGPVAVVVSVDDSVHIAAASNKSIGESTLTDKRILAGAGVVILVLIVSLALKSGTGTTQPDVLAEIDTKPVPVGDSIVETDVPANPPVVVADKLKPVDLDTIRQRVVWVGVRFDGRLFCEGSGWLANGRQVITSGRLAQEMQEYQEYREDGQQVCEPVIWSANAPQPIREVRLHPRFEAADRGSVASLQHDVGVLILETPLEGVPAPPFGQESEFPLKSSRPLKLLGYHDPLDRKMAYDPVQVQLVETPAEVTGSNFEVIGVSPGYQLKAISRPGLDGAIVLNERGAIVGVAGLIESDYHLVPVTTLRVLLTRM